MGSIECGISGGTTPGAPGVDVPVRVAAREGDRGAPVGPAREDVVEKPAQVFVAEAEGAMMALEEARGAPRPLDGPWPRPSPDERAHVIQRAWELLLLRLEDEDEAVVDAAGGVDHDRDRWGGSAQRGESTWSAFAPVQSAM